MNIVIKQIGLTEVEALLHKSRELFFTAFAHLNNVDDMAGYASKAFTIEKLTEEVTNPYSRFYFACLGDEITGYLKLNTNTAQTEFQHPEALEMERIYVDSRFQNQQIGRQLLQFAVDKALENKLSYIWLGVWDANHKAVRFYKRHGFEVFSNHEFMLGNDKQTDLLMKKSLITS